MHENEFMLFEGITDYNQLGNLAIAIAVCVNDAFEGGVTQEDTLQHLKGDMVLTYMKEESQEVLAFSSVNFISPADIFKKPYFSDIKGTYLGATTVAKQAQGKGLYKQMNKIILDETIRLKHPFIFMRTQNPRVEDGMASSIENFQTQGKISSYNLERIKIENAYGQMLTKSKPVSKKTQFNELNYDNGDAYILFFNLIY